MIFFPCGNSAREKLKIHIVLLSFSCLQHFYLFNPFHFHPIRSLLSGYYIAFLLSCIWYRTFEPKEIPHFHEHLIQNISVPLISFFLTKIDKSISMRILNGSSFVKKWRHRWRLIKLPLCFVTRWTVSKLE